MAPLANAVAIRNSFGYLRPVSVTPEQLARTLVRRNRLLVEQRRREAADLRKCIDGLVSDVASAGECGRIWLIGSLQSGSFGRRSDVDLVCEGLEPEHLPALWRRFERALGRSVDLLRIEEIDAAFAQRVREEGELLL
jgi:predicted nucleotidyltransferase